jgi:hypothetical protein
VVTLNETGQVLNYRQPHIDQWLVALEKQFSGFVKMEALYTRRSNKNMVALVDRNRDVNYTRFTRVRVYDQSGLPLPYGGAPSSSRRFISRTTFFWSASGAWPPGTAPTRLPFLG